MSRKDDFIPANDLQFLTWLTMFEKTLNENLEELGLTPEQVGFVTDLREEMESSISNLDRARREVREAMGLKRCARTAAENALRPFVRTLHQNPAMGSAIRGALGLHEQTTHRTRREMGTEAPALCLEPFNGGVRVHFGTDPGNERLNTRPKWAQATVIFRKREGEDKYTMVGCSTQSPFYDTIDEPAIRVSYMARYQGRRGQGLGQQSREIACAAGGPCLEAKPKVLAKAA